MKNRKEELKGFVVKHKKKIVIASIGVGAIGISVLGLKYIPRLNNSTSRKAIEDVINSEVPEKVATAVKETATNVVKEYKAPRYLVEFKAFKTGEWYPKTRTDFINSAYSSASCNNFGRAYRIIDTHTNKVLKEVVEDAGMAACNGYPNGAPLWYYC